MRRTRWVDKKNRRITQYMPQDMKVRIALAKDIAAGKATYEARPRVGPKHPPIILPEKPNQDGY